MNSGLDPRQAQQLEEAIMTKVRALIASKMQVGTDDLSGDSKLALQQLNQANGTLKVELAKILDSIRVLSENQTALQDSIRKTRESVDVGALSGEIKTVKSDLHRLFTRVDGDTTPKATTQLQEALTKVLLRLTDLEAGVSGQKKSAVVTTSQTNGVKPEDLQKLASDLAQLREAMKIVQSSRSAPPPPTAIQPTIVQSTSYDDTEIRTSLSLLNQKLLTFLGTQTQINPAEISELKAAVEAVRNKVQENQVSSEQLTLRIAALENSVQSLTSAVQSVPRLDIFEATLGQLESKTKILADNNSALSQTISTLVNIAASKSELESISSRIQSLESRLAQPPADKVITAGPSGTMQPFPPQPIQQQAPVQLPFAQHALPVQPVTQIMGNMFGQPILGGGVPVPNN